MSDCVPFTGHVRSDDYGIVSRSRNGKARIFLAHRWVWAEAHGLDPWSVPSWVQIKHTCKINWCVNIDHLFTDVSDAIISTLPKAGTVTTTPTRASQTPAALAQRAKTVCSEGHQFRTEPDDTACIGCKIQKKQDIRYEVALATP
jgi:hypothetical protein